MADALDDWIGQLTRGGVDDEDDERLQQPKKLGRLILTLEFSVMQSLGFDSFDVLICSKILYFFNKS